MNSNTQDELNRIQAENFEASIERYITAPAEADVAEWLELEATLPPEHKLADWLQRIELATAKSIGESVARRWRDRSFLNYGGGGSPLERVLTLAVCAFAESVCGEAVEVKACGSIHEDVAPRLVDRAGRVVFDCLSVCLQHRIRAYSADLLLTGYVDHAVTRVAVEVDGHEFHERTKAQVEHDKKRDRAFQADGYYVLRFTGAEVFSNPVKCAKEAVDLALGRQ